MRNKHIKDIKPTPLKVHHMPKNFNVSLKAYGGGAVSYTHLTLPTICSV